MDAARLIFRSGVVGVVSEYGCCRLAGLRVGGKGRTMANREAFEDGYDAYWEGMDVSGNPHDEDSEEYRLWEDGWRGARGHDYDESDG